MTYVATFILIFAYAAVLTLLVLNVLGGSVAGVIGSVVLLAAISVMLILAGRPGPNDPQ